MAIAIFLLFLLFAGLMHTRRMPALLALPAMAVLIAVLPSLSHPMDAITLVFDKGVTRLAGAMVNAVFGAILADVVYTCGIAETLVKKASELAGDRPVPVALLMMFATSLAFLALGGLGSVIMVGTLVLPVMIGVGLRPIVACAVLLFGISIGGAWNVAGWGFFQDVLKLPVSTISIYATITGTALIVVGTVYVLLTARAVRSAWDQPAETPPPPICGFALLTPLLPVALILGCKYLDKLTAGHIRPIDVNINAALILGALYGILTTRPRELINRLSGAITEGIRASAPVLGLMIGIGMVITALMSDPVRLAITPVLASVIPHSALGYVLFFGMLSPLALYRGPLNLYGLGAGVGAVLTAIFAPQLVAGALMATGLVQGVCDPTNTMNVWVAGFTKVEAVDILKSTLPYVWSASFIALCVIALTHW